VKVPPDVTRDFVGAAMGSREAELVISVSGNQSWTDTGLDLATGSSVEITASGTIKITKEDSGRMPIGDPSCTGKCTRTFFTYPILERYTDIR
jgi:hypothetical protein